MSKTDAFFKVDDLVMQFGGLKALGGVDLEVHKGQVLGLLGPNGAGKTTMFNVATGMYSPTSGSLTYEGQSIAGLKAQRISEMGIIRTFQKTRLWFDISVLDNLLLGMFMRPKPGILKSLFQYKEVERDLRAKSDEALEVMGIFNPELAVNYYRRVKELSLVDLRRVEICRAILAQPKLLLLDEPAAGMDPSETCQLMEDLGKVRRRIPGLGIIIIEHDMEVISGIAERVVVLNFGKKIAEGTFQEIKADPEVRAAYLGDECHA